MTEILIDELVKAVTANPKYENIDVGLIKSLSATALERGFTGKSGVKFVRNKLHQVGGAYFRQKVDYKESAKLISHLPNDPQSPEIKSYAVNMMKSHASTAERIPILDSFYSTCLASIAPVSSVLDLACGMNPLAIPWMPLAENFTYQACDIYLDMVRLINGYFEHFNYSGNAFPCDLVNANPTTETEVTFLLKTIPCLEQVDKSIGRRLLGTIPSKTILLSFPIHSLGGRQKGMQKFYTEHFYELLSNTNWKVEEFVFSTELAFLVKK